MDKPPKWKGYNQGFAEGYRAGLADGLAGKTPGPDEKWEQPLAMLGLSTLARNCLIAAGCETIGHVAQLPLDRIRYMRGLGAVSADEVARALHRLRIRHTHWDGFLLDK